MLRVRNAGALGKRSLGLSTAILVCFIGRLTSADDKPAHIRVDVNATQLARHLLKSEITIPVRGGKDVEINEIEPNNKPEEATPTEIGSIANGQFVHPPGESSEPVDWLDFRPRTRRGNEFVEQSIEEFDGIVCIISDLNGLRLAQVANESSSCDFFLCPVTKRLFVDKIHQRRVTPSVGGHAGTMIQHKLDQCTVQARQWTAQHGKA